MYFRMVALQFHLVIRFVLPQELRSRSGGVSTRVVTLCCSFPKAFSHNGAQEPTGKGERGKEHTAIPLGLSGSESDCRHLREMCTCEKGGKLEEKKGDLWGHFRVGTTDPSSTSPAFKKKKKDLLGLSKNITLVVGIFRKDIHVTITPTPAPAVMISTSSVIV